MEELSTLGDSQLFQIIRRVPYATRRNEQAHLWTCSNRQVEYLVIRKKGWGG